MSILGKRPRFPEASQLAEIFDEDSGLVVRDNTEYLANMKKLSVFTRPTQLGKSTLLSLAEMVYSKKKTAPPEVAKNIPAQERNAAYVVQFDFLNVDITTNNSWQEDLRRIDSSLFHYIKHTVEMFVTIINKELERYFVSPHATASAGVYLRHLAEAVAAYSATNGTDEFLVVLVDEFDRPLRDTLFRMLNQFEKNNVMDQCPHYRSFFSACKVVGQKQKSNKVWVTGVLPIALDLICDFKPVTVTFSEDMLDAVGLRDDDVDKMLREVHTAEPFADKEEMEGVGLAIRDHANHLKFLSGLPLYHTRMVNELMEKVLNRTARSWWLKDLSRLPTSITRESAPSSIYKLLQKSTVCREVAKDLIANRGIRGELNDRLNLPDVCRADISKDIYLTLLVHLGIASVDTSDHEYVFRATSRYFRSEYLQAMLEVTLVPLFGFNSVEEIYKNQTLLQEFMETLPSSGMAKMISWAKSSRKNRILELQFQGFLLGELHESLMADDATILPTQEDKISPEMRTDIQRKGRNTILILELKQKPTKLAGPTEADMGRFHKQLRRYVKEVSEQNPELLVAGFVVVMYANGTMFHIEPHVT